VSFDVSQALKTDNSRQNNLPLGGTAALVPPYSFTLCWIERNKKLMNIPIPLFVRVGWNKRSGSTMTSERTSLLSKTATPPVFAPLH